MFWQNNPIDSDDDEFVDCSCDTANLYDAESLHGNEDSFDEGKTLCSDHEHFDVTVVDAKLEMNSDGIFHCVFESSSVLSSFMTERNASDVQDSAWTQNLADASVDKRREVSYSLPYGSAVVQVKEYQTMKRLGSHYLVNSQSINSGVPYSDHFNVLTRYCIRRVSRSQCHLLITCKVDFIKRVWGLSSMIEREVHQSVRKTCTLLVDILTRESMYCKVSCTGSNMSYAATTEVPISYEDHRELTLCALECFIFYHFPDMDRVDSFIRRSKRGCFCGDIFSEVRALIEDTENSLFQPNIFRQESRQEIKDCEDFCDAMDVLSDTASPTSDVIFSDHGIVSYKQTYDKCVETGQQIRLMIEKLVELRMETARQLVNVASALEKVRRDVCIARVTGSSVAVAGGVAGIVGTALTIATVGLAAPIAVAVVGGITSLAGAATSIISQIVEKFMSSNELKTAQTALEADYKANETIHELTVKLEVAAQSLDINSLSNEEKVTFFIFHKEFSESGLRLPTVDLSYMKVPAVVFKVASIVLSVGGKAANAVCNGVRIAGLIRVATEVAETTVSGARTAGSAGNAVVETAGIAVDVVGGTGTVVRTGMTGARVLAGVGIAAGGIGLAVDIYDIVMASISLAKAGKTDNSNRLLNTAKSLEESAATLKGHLGQVSDWFIEKAPVMAHLERFQCSDVTGSTELNEAERSILNSVYEEEQANGPNDRVLVNNIKLFYDVLKVKLNRIESSNDDEGTNKAGVNETCGVESHSNEAYEDSDSDNTSSKGPSPSVTYDSVDIMLIARGSIPGDSWQWETGAALVDHPGINDVTLYQPWNCAMDATVAHAACRGALKPGSRHFKHCFHSNPKGQSKLNCTQNKWNFMTRAKQTRIPQVVVDPLSMSDDDLYALNVLLCRYDSLVEDDTVRLVVPYAISASDSQSYGRVPLSVICQALGAACQVLSLTATVHVLSDLTVTNGPSQGLVSEITQYCYVTGDVTNGRPTMTCHSTDSDVTDFRKTVRPFLSSQ